MILPKDSTWKENLRCTPVLHHLPSVGHKQLCTCTRSGYFLVKTNLSYCVCGVIANQNQTQSSVENFVTEISKFLWKYVSDYYSGPGRQSDFFHVKLHFTPVNEVVEYTLE